MDRCQKHTPGNSSFALWETVFIQSLKLSVGIHLVGLWSVIHLARQVPNGEGSFWRVHCHVCSQDKVFLNGFKLLDISWKSQIFCPWISYFLGLLLGYSWLNKIILPLLPFLQLWECKENQEEALLILIISLTAWIILELMKPSLSLYLSIKALLFKDLLNWRLLELHLQNCPPPGMGAGCSLRLSWLK